jgi:hypothetical protein
MHVLPKHCEKQWYTTTLTVGDLTMTCLLMNRHLPGAVGVMWSSVTSAAPLGCWYVTSTVLGGTKSVTLVKFCLFDVIAVA